MTLREELRLLSIKHKANHISISTLVALVESGILTVLEAKLLASGK